MIRKGATRLTSVLESCGTPRGDSTYLPLSDNSKAAGDGGGSENTLAWKVVSERRVLGDCVHCLNVGCGQVKLSVNKKVDQEKLHKERYVSRHVAPQAKMMRTDNADRVACVQQEPEDMKCEGQQAVRNKLNNQDTPQETAGDSPTCKTGPDWDPSFFTGRIDAAENADMNVCAPQDSENWNVLTDCAQNKPHEKQETGQPYSTLNCPEDSMMASRMGAQTFVVKKNNRGTKFGKGSRCFDLLGTSHTKGQGAMNLRLQEIADTMTSPSERAPSDILTGRHQTR